MSDIPGPFSDPGDSGGDIDPVPYPDIDGADDGSGTGTPDVRIADKKVDDENFGSGSSGADTGTERSIVSSDKIDVEFLPLGASDVKYEGKHIARASDAMPHDVPVGSKDDETEASGGEGGEASSFWDPFDPENPDEPWSPLDGPVPAKLDDREFYDNGAEQTFESDPEELGFLDG